MFSGDWHFQRELEKVVELAANVAGAPSTAAVVEEQQ
jgi:hypothetical protein